MTASSLSNGLLHWGGCACICAQHLVLLVVLLFTAFLLIHPAQSADPQRGTPPQRACASAPGTSGPSALAPLLQCLPAAAYTTMLLSQQSLRLSFPCSRELVHLEGTHLTMLLVVASSGEADLHRAAAAAKIDLRRARVKRGGSRGMTRASAHPAAHPSQNIRSPGRG